MNTGSNCVKSGMEVVHKHVYDTWHVVYKSTVPNMAMAQIFEVIFDKFKTICIPISNTFLPKCSNVV
jgi:hypothetical protein